MRTPRATRAAAALWGDRSGQALVETALVIPILLMLLFGTVTFSRAWNVHHTLNNAARDGARLASLANATITADTVQSRIRQTLAMYALNATAATIVVTGADGATGDPAQVQITYPLQLPLLAMLHVSPTLNLSAAVVMRHE